LYSDQGASGGAARFNVRVIMVSMLLLFLALQRRFIEGISASGLGGA
jgi:ABC-type glycerol-3-phosphate transport system permease component